MYIKGLFDRLVRLFYMRFVLSANRANDPSNTAFWINIGTEHFPPGGCLASPSTHDSVNIDQTRRSVFFYLYRELTRDYRVYPDSCFKGFNYFSRLRGERVFGGFVRIILSRLIIQKYFLFNY